jgi:hypothetical protein
MKGLDESESPRGRKAHGDGATFYIAASRQGLHRLPDGDHRPAVDDHLLPCRIASRPSDDGGGAFRRPVRDGRVCRRSTDHRLHCAIDLTAVRVYLSEQFPTALRGRGQYFGESTGRLVAGVIAPFLLEPYTGSPTIFFGTLAAVASIGAFVPVLFGKETVGQLETVSEGFPNWRDTLLQKRSIGIVRDPGGSVPRSGY